MQHENKFLLVLRLFYKARYDFQTDLPPICQNSCMPKYQTPIKNSVMQNLLPQSCWTTIIPTFYQGSNKEHALLSFYLYHTFCLLPCYCPASHKAALTISKEVLFIFCCLTRRWLYPAMPGGHQHSSFPKIKKGQ